MNSKSFLLEVKFDFSVWTFCAKQKLYKLRCFSKVLPTQLSSPHLKANCYILLISFGAILINSVSPFSLIRADGVNLKLAVAFCIADASTCGELQSFTVGPGATLGKQLLVNYLAQWKISSS